ncbi:hypothetical protein ACS0TY_010489 [Phlomoides rotata]
MALVFEYVGDVVRGVQGVCLIYVRHIGILKAVEYILAFKEPVGCLQFKDLCYNTGRAFTLVKFDQIMEQIK